jgi:hypothetical protein
MCQRINSVSQEVTRQLHCFVLLPYFLANVNIFYKTWYKCDKSPKIKPTLIIQRFIILDMDQKLNSKLKSSVLVRVLHRKIANSVYAYKAQGRYIHSCIYILSAFSSFSFSKLKYGVR